MNTYVATASTAYSSGKTVAKAVALFAVGILLIRKRAKRRWSCVFFILFSNYVKYLTDMGIRLHQRLSSTLRIAVASHFSTMPTCVCCLMRI